MDAAVAPAQESANIRAWLERGAARHPDKVFVRSLDQGTSITYAEALRLARRLGHRLKAKGFGANERVALLANNCLEHLMVYYGVMYYGATICTIHVEMNALIIDELVSALAPKLVLREAELAAFLAGLADESDSALAPVNGPDDVASIFYTSGTTETPKGVPCTFRDLETNVANAARSFAIREGDVVLDYRSFNWMSAQTLSALGALSAGASLVIAQKFSRSRFFEWIRETKASVVAGNPTVINMLNSEPVAIHARDLPHLRYITSSSAPLLAQDWKSFESRYGIPIMQGYGSSETGWIAASSENARRLGSVGRPFAYHDLAIVEPSGRKLAASEIGLIELGAPPHDTYRYLMPDGRMTVHAHGRYRTGDLGYLDADGFLFVTGREKDLIIRGGVNISPVEVDNVLNQMPQIAEAASAGVPDPIYGEEVAAFVVLRAGESLTEEDVFTFCRPRLAQPKTPKKIVFCAALPKTERGKLDRKSLSKLVP